VTPEPPPLSVEPPVSPSLQKRLGEAIAAVPDGKRGTLNLDAAWVNGQAGVQGSIGQRITPTWSWGAWAALGSGRGREVGGRLSATW
jgi:hypothetical protein